MNASRLPRIRSCLVIASLPLVVLAGCYSNEQAAIDASQDQDTSLARVVNLDNQLVEASCGQCLFDMEGSACDLAIRYEGNTYFVDGSNIDDHGDAHDAMGMCNAIREARVTGEIVDGRFLAERFDVLPAKTGESNDDGS